jgi:hypothetical protein
VSCAGGFASAAGSRASTARRDAKSRDGGVSDVPGCVVTNGLDTLEPKASISIGIGAVVSVANGSLVQIESVVADDAMTELVLWFDRI